MRKTTVYLNEEEADALRQLSVATGTSQAELIRAAVRQAVSHPPKRQFRSLGQGASTVAESPRWGATNLCDKVFGGR